MNLHIFSTNDQIQKTVKKKNEWRLPARQLLRPEGFWTWASVIDRPH